MFVRIVATIVLILATTLASATEKTTKQEITESALAISKTVSMQGITCQETRSSGVTFSGDFIYMAVRKVEYRIGHMYDDDTTVIYVGVANGGGIIIATIIGGELVNFNAVGFTDPRLAPKYLRAIGAEIELAVQKCKK